MTGFPHASITAPRTRLAYLASGALLILASACNNASTQKGGNNAPNSVVLKPDGSAFIADPNNLGLSPEPRIRDTFWGRRVDVFGLDGAGDRTLMQPDFLIGPSLVSTAGVYSLETSAVTGGQALVILRDVTDASPGGGRAQFFDLLKAAEGNLAPLSDQGLGGSGIFTMVPRNATIVVVFDDLMDPNLLTRETVRPRTGVPPVNTYDARIFADPNHGDLVVEGGVTRFYPTRVYIDPTITEVEAAADGQALAVNTAGFPASLDANLANVSIRIPTRVNLQTGQSVILKNRSGHPLTTDQNGSVDFSSETVPVVRNARSGGRQSVTGDPFNGFLPDTTPPQVLGSLGGFITGAPFQGPADDEDEFTIPSYQFSTIACAQKPVVGDVLQQPGIFAEVIEEGLPPVAGLATNVRVRLLAFPPSYAGPADWIGTALGSATFLSPWDPDEDSGNQGCFVTLNPTPLTPPTTGINTVTSFSFLFGEPMDRGSFSAFDSILLTRDNGQLVVGQVDGTLDLLKFSIMPNIPLAHTLGTDETYRLALSAQQSPPTDLAGNQLLIPLPAITYQVDPSQNTARNSNRISRFSAVDEEEPIGNVGAGEAALPEFAGQHFYDLARGLIRPRPVTRFEAVADRSQPVGSFMVPGPNGTKTPLTSFGSKLQAFWRPVDVNLPYDDSTGYNVDIEGLNWAPFQDLVLTDRFEQFEIRLSHGRFSPDEYVCTVPFQFVFFPTSGVVNRFQENLLSLIDDPLKVVHPRFRGFSISPGDVFASATGSRLVPFPLNRGIPTDEYRYYTWRDTSILARGGEAATIVPPLIDFRAKGAAFDGGCVPTAEEQLATPALWLGENAQSVCLPLLMEFRCFPDNGSFSTNLLDISITQAIAPQPFFRAHSTGGVGTNGTFMIDPDLESVANGGFNPTSIPPNQATPGNDTRTYVGSMDLVVRVSRSYSLWWLATNVNGGAFSAPKYNVPVIEPRAEDQPEGTSVQVAFRGASSISNFGTAPEGRTALAFDAYGDRYNNNNHDAASANTRVSFFEGDATWHDPIAGPNPVGINGAQYYQVRLTFQSDPISGLVPVLSALGVTWEE